MRTDKYIPPSSGNPLFSLRVNCIASTLNSRGVNIGFNLIFRSMKKNMEKVVTMLAVIMGFSVIALANIWIP